MVNDNRSEICRIGQVQSRNRARDAGDCGALSRPHPEMGRRHRGRRLLVHDPCPSRRRGDRLGSVRDGADHDGESGRSGIGRTRNVVAPTSLAGQFEQPYGPMGPPTLFTIPVLRYMKTYGLTHEQLAMVAVVQREWAGKNPRATFKTPITVEDVLNSRMIAYPFRLLQCCLVTDGGGALILVAAERAKDFPQKPVYLIGTGENVETPMVSQMEDFTSSRAFRVAGPKAFAEAGLTHNDVDHLMIYDAFAHLPIYGLEDLGFGARREAGALIAERNTAPRR